MTLPFEKSEYLDRVRRTKVRMEEAGIEVLICTNPANMNYLTGYDGWSFYVHQFVIVALDQEEPIWIGRAQDATGAEFTTYLDGANIVGYQDDYVQSTEKHPMDFVADQLKSRGWDKRAIGVEMDDFQFTGASLASIARNLPDASVVNANVLVNWVRVIKSEQEIAYMRQAARIVERAMDVALQAIVPGARQCDVVADIVQAQIAGTPEFGGDYTAIVPLLPTGAFTRAPHMTWSDAPFEADGVTVIELAGCRRRYHCPLARTLWLGEPPAAFTDAVAYVLDGIAASIEAAKTGATCEEVFAAWQKATAGSGIVKDSRMGYSTGLNYPPDWGERTISIRPGDKTVLQTDMTVHLIPGIWMADWGIHLSETIRITEQGGEPLAKHPRELVVKR